MNTTATEDVHTDRETFSKIDELNKQAWEIHITQPKSGLELSTEAKKLSEQYSYQKGLAYAIRNMGVCNRYLTNLETALSLSLQALDMFVELNDIDGEAQSYVSIGAIYFYMGDHERCLNFFLKGLRYSEEGGNKETQAYAYNGAGYMYGVVLGNHKKGLELMQKALELSKEPGISQDLAPRVLDGIAEIYENAGQLEEAYLTSKECLEISEKLSQKVTEGYALFRIGNVFMMQNKLSLSKEYFFRSLHLRQQTGDRYGEADVLLQLGKLFTIEANEQQSKQHFEHALQLAEEIKAKAILYKIHEALSDFYERKEDFKLFVNHFKLFHKYKSEVLKEEQETKQKYLSIQHDLEKLKQEAEITRLTNVVMKEKNEELEKKTEELEQSYNSISVLSKIGRDITSTLDLDTILNTVYENVNQLMNATIFGIGIYREAENSIEFRLSIEEGKRYQPYHRKMDDKSQLAVWCIENKREVFINDIEKEFSNYLKDIDLIIIRAAAIKSAALEDGSLPKNPNSLIYLPLQVKDKIIGLISVQSYEKHAYTHYHLDILKTLASYLSAALYNAQSFQTLHNTLTELKVTQQQLIQSEKMASLGELTAGIAHEIQNPLNFVNNFSEVNKELIAEMNEEIIKGNIDEVKSIAIDIKENEEKINFHGKRADGIVKGMLQHSRASSGKKEPTDINILTDEYLRLSYHGLRAKDKTFNATLETLYEESLDKVNILSQDVGRVILNLFTNAFYSVSQKKKLLSDGYVPTVWVSTKKRKEAVEIMIKDNGTGVPQKVLDKIFQPFFTTKPTGEGTGLGLSMSYDIIKAHGGELKVESTEGEGAEFIIIIPTEKN